jgi:hypothetical protein
VERVVAIEWIAEMDVEMLASDDGESEVNELRISRIGSMRIAFLFVFQDSDGLRYDILTKREAFRH